MEQLSITRLTWETTPSQEIIVKFLSNSQNILLSAEVDDVLVGQVIGYILDHWDKDEPMLFLYSIDVEETYRRMCIRLKETQNKLKDDFIPY